MRRRRKKFKEMAAHPSYLPIPVCDSVWAISPFLLLSRYLEIRVTVDPYER